MIPAVWKRRAEAHRRETPLWEQLTELDEYEQIWRSRLEYLVPVHEPLVLIAQIKRSGGTLLSQLFDGHPECHAHASELEIGHPTRLDWPQLELGAGPDRWFEVLYENNVRGHLLKGYRKAGHGNVPERFPFLYSPRLQRAIFEQCVTSQPIQRERDVLNCYFTAYFNAWLDNHNLYTGPKKVLTAFEPRLSKEPANLDRFFSAYPDGVLISSVRDPRSWYASARSLKGGDYKELETGLELWRESTEATLDSVSRYGDRVVLLTYEQLVLETEETMRRVAERLGISMSPVLLMPTFNGRPIRANSSYTVDGHGVLADQTTAYRSVLDAETVARIEEVTGDLYERASALSRAG